MNFFAYCLKINLGIKNASILYIYITDAVTNFKVIQLRKSRKKQNYLVVRCVRIKRKLQKIINTVLDYYTLIARRFHGNINVVRQSAGFGC